MKDYKGYIILAADGSGVNVPITEETLLTYGTSSRKGTKAQEGLGLSCLYDCINKTILTCSVNRVKFNEAAEAEKHMSELPKLVGNRKSIILLDRGYPSIPLFLRLNRRGQKFVFRLGSKDFKQERGEMEALDERVSIAITKSRLQHYKGTNDYDMMLEAGSIALRIVKLTLPSGVEECLITNLPANEFSADELMALYRFRWGIETAFDTLKNKLMIENFTGTKPILIEQDIYASIYICNLASDMIADAEAELETPAPLNDDPSTPLDGITRRSPNEYPMAVNRSFAIGILKDMMIAALLADSSPQRSVLFRQMVDEVKKEVLPVRPNRHFNRTNGVLAGKFANSRKRCF